MLDAAVYRRNSLMNDESPPKRHYRIRSTSSNTSNTSSPRRRRQPLLETKEEDFALSCFEDYERFRDDPTNSINIYTTTYENAPSWYGSEGYVIHGYRRVTNSWKGCFLSLLYIHNETGNIYTHLIGFLLVPPLILVLFLDWMSGVETTVVWDYVAQLGFLIGLMACLCLSSLFHLCTCHSRRVSLQCNKADYVGIVCLIVYICLISGSFYPMLYYGFYCDPFWKRVYSVSITLLGSLTMYVTINPEYATVAYRKLRTGIFILLGCMGVVPALHHVVRYGFPMAIKSFSLPYVLTMGALYLIGAFIYAFRIPERWFPGSFDIIGHSHQIWHLFVLAAAAVHFCGVVKIFYWWHEHNHACAYSDQEMRSWYA